MKRPRASTLERQTREKTVSRSFKTITPVAGSINVVLWKTRYYAVIVLPLGDFGSIGLTGSIWETGLWKDCPKGYSCNEKSRIIYRNQKYEESGRSQQYPVKYFGRRAAPVWYGWIEAQHLKPLKEFYEGKLVQNYFVAMQFSAGRETSQADISATIESRNSTTQAACRIKSRGCAIDRSKRQREVDGDDASNDGGDDDDDAGDSNYANEDESSVTDDDYVPSENESDKQARKRLKGRSVVCPTQRRSYARTAATVPSHLRAGGQKTSCRVPSRVSTSTAFNTQASFGDVLATDGGSQICNASGPVENSYHQLGSVGVNVDLRDMQSVRFEASKAASWCVSGGTRRAPYAIMSGSIHDLSDVYKTPFQSPKSSIADIPGNVKGAKGIAISMPSDYASHHEIRSHSISEATRSLEPSISLTATTSLRARPINDRKPTVENIVAANLCCAEPRQRAFARHRTHSSI